MGACLSAASVAAGDGGTRRWLWPGDDCRVRLSPNIQIAALDVSATRLEAAAKNLAAFANATIERGDAHSLPFPTSSFDLVYARFVFEYLPDKQRAATELARVCRPGGTVLVQDLDGQLISHYPPDQELDRNLARALTILEQAGFDTHVGRKLGHFLRTAGLTDLQVTAQRYHLIVGSIGPRERLQWKTKLDIAAGALERLGFTGARRLKAQFLAYLDREDTMTFSHLFTAIARKP